MTTDPQTAAHRIRTYLRLLPTAHNLGGEIAYSEEFRSEGWPRSCYAPTRDDVEALLAAVPVAAPPTTEQTALRERVAEALATADGWKWGPGLGLDNAFSSVIERYRGRADAVLAVLPASADRAAALREAADDLATAFGDPMAKHIGALGASHLRRRAREIEAGQASEEQPETPLEKRLRYSERRNDELRAECLRRGKTVLEQAEKIVALERQIDEVRSQLGAEILRAGQAEAELRRLTDGEEQAGGPSREATEPQPDAQGDAQLLALVRDFLDPDPCSFDHHGYCQAHAAGFGGEPLSCPHGRARKLLAAAAAPVVSSRPGTEQEARPCAECRHPKDTHQDGDDPVTPGTCSACEADDPDEAHHDYRAGAAS